MRHTDDIALFLRVLDLGSISAAARELGLSVAVASKRLKRLELELGVRLLHRTTRQLRATPEGLQLAEQGRPLIEDLEALADALRQDGVRVSGTLRLTAPASFGSRYLSPLMAMFMARHPQVRVSVDLTDQVIDLVGAGLDLAVRIGELADSRLVARRLAVNRRVLCASPAYLARHGTPKTPADLAGHQCLRLFGSQGRQDVWQLTGIDGKPVSVRVGGRFESNHGELLRDAVLNGFGIAQHSTWHIGDDLRAGRVVAVLPDYPLRDTGIYAVTPQRHLVPPRVNAFIHFLAENFGDHPPWDRDLLFEHKRRPRSAKGST
ncbi:LysR family transcriptional regulator [Dyella sp.]|uniref:LysR family transcriptional regulator n=1 Tax=Dyella sp. TaxID=1869338 RepID=UPI003F7D69DA